MMRLIFAILLSFLWLTGLNAQSTVEKFLYNSDQILNLRDIYINTFPDQDLTVTTHSVSGDTGIVYVQCLSKSGKINWSKIFKLSNYFRVTSVMTVSSGLLIGGYIDDVNGNVSCLFFIDKFGNMAWQNYYLPLASSSAIYSLSANALGEILVYGYYSKSDTAGHYILRLGADGKIIDCRTLLNSGWGEGFASKDGGFFINSIKYIKKYSSTADIQWYRKQPEGYTSSRFGAIDNENNFYCVSETSGSFMIFKFTSAGKEIWQKHIEFDFSAFKILNNKLIFINQSANSSYIFNTDGVFICSNQYNYQYTDVAEAPLNRYWLIGKNLIHDKLGFVFARTDSQLKTACTKEIETKSLTDRKFNFKEFKGDLKLIHVQMKTLEVELFPLIYQTDTLCFSNKPLPVNLGNDTTLCLDDSLILDAGNTESEYVWSTGETTQQIKVTATGTYKVLVKNAFSETGEDSINVTFEPKPEISWHFNKSIADPGDKLILLDESSTAYKRLWILPNGDTSSQKQLEYIIPENGEYKFTLRLTNTSGCSNQITKTLKAAYYRLYFPDAFSPNDDELNEVFAPNGYGITNYHFKIYNRWGELVFDGENKGWDGKFRNKPAAEGMYFYKAEIFNVQQKHEYLSGNVYLIK